MDDLNKMFVDSNEKEVATLGGDYLRNFLATGSLSKGFCGVSNKRVYFRGKCYHKVKGHYKSTKEERTVDLKDVTGTGFVESRFFLLMVLASISLLWCAFALISMFTEKYLDGSEIAMIVIFGIMPSVLLWLIYFVCRVRLFEISFAGGKIAFKASNYNEEEMQEFQKALRIAKDNYTEVSKPVMSASGADELKKYKELLDAGVINQAEFDEAKKKILG